jgi:DNA invertase Pin-like site-specific DNA recombinase
LFRDERRASESNYAMSTLQKQPDEITQQPVAVLYAAKSSADEHDSIPRQLADGRKLADDPLRARVLAEFSDEGKSAWKGNRGDGLAAAKAAAEAAARKYGSCFLIVQHTDRLARGDAKRADHLVEVALWALRHDVAIKSVQDPTTCESGLAFAAMMGDRNEADSARKSQAVASGIRGAAEQGKWLGGILADGYRLIKGHDERGHETREVAFDPDRKPLWDLVWDLARKGYSANAIVAELDRHGWVTQPRKKAHKPRPFDANRVRLALNNPFYAGLSAHRGEVVGEGRWPRYVEPEDFYRLKRERAERSHVEHRKVGRPVERFLLAGLTECGDCGGPLDSVNGYRRVDGSRTMSYVCRLHRERPQDCGSKPWNARAVDGTVLKHLPLILSDIDTLKGAVTAARDSDRGRLEAEAKLARDERKKSAKAMERMAARIAVLYANGEDAKAEALEAALGHTQVAEEAAKVRLTAALDALAALPEAEDADAFDWDALRESILTRVEDAAGDIKRLRLALAEFVERVTLKHGTDEIQIDARLRPEVVARIVRDRLKLDLDSLAESWEKGDPELLRNLADSNPRSPW